MHVAVMQPYFFPYLGYYQLANAVDQLVFLDDVTFINRGWINRNCILLNDAAHLFTVPLKEASQNKLIKDIDVANDGRWRAKFLKQLEHAYARAPMFEVTYQCIENLILQGPRQISALAVQSIHAVMTYLGKPSNVMCSSDLSYDRSLRGQQKILAICKAVGAATYVNPIGGTTLYDPAGFRQTGMELRFVKSRPISYRQWACDKFVPNLSMIDVLMFNTPGHAATLLDEYQLLTHREACGEYGYATAADHSGRV